jgi:tetratricopeptide (TPR) repeat protein
MIYGITFFQASMLNNDGLTKILDGAPQSLVAIYARDIEAAEKAAQDTKLSPEARQNKAEEANLLRKEFEKERQEAMDLFKRSIEINPYFTTNYYKLGTLESAGPEMRGGPEDYAQAVKTYRTLQEYGPDYSQVHLNLGMAYYNMGMLDESLRELRRSAHMTICVDYVEDASNMLFLQRLTEVAQERGSPLLAAGDVDDIDALARRLLKAKDPLSKFITAALPGETRRALENYRGRKASDTERSELTKMLVEGLNTLLMRTDFHEEQRFAGVALSQSTRDRLEDKPKTDMEITELNRALLADAFAGMIAPDPREEAVRNCKRLVDWWQNLFDKNTYMPSLRKPERRTELQESLAVLYANYATSGGYYRDQIRAWEHLYELAPQNKAVLQNLADTYTEHGDARGLIAFLQRALDKKPADPGLRSQMARAQLLAGNAREAKRQILILQKTDPNHEDIQYLFFKLYDQTGNAALARQHASLYQEVGHTARWLKEVQHYLGSGKPEEAGKEKG